MIFKVNDAFFGLSSVVSIILSAFKCTDSVSVKKFHLLSAR